MKLKYADTLQEQYKWKNGKITFYDTDINITQLISLEVDILGSGKYNKVIFDNMNIIDFGSNLFLVEIEDINKEKYKKLFIDNFEQDGYFAKELINKRHSPKYKGHFEYEGKTYIMVDGVNKLTGEIDADKGVYKGVIVNPELYYSNQESVNNTTTGVGDEVSRTLYNK